MGRLRKEVDTSTWSGQFGANLSRLMSRKHVTVEMLASTLVKPNGEPYGISTVYGWMQGKNLPTIAVLRDIADALSLCSTKSLMPD